MDLNHLYSQHQLSVMSANASISRVDRAKHLAAAERFACRIGSYQFARGAGAAAGWLDDRTNPNRRADDARSASL